MADGEEKSTDLYGVLELKKECSPAELRNAYKKLALKWHPDRCSALGNSEHVEQAKKKFQAIQEAYSVLSDSDRRFLYDLGIHDFDDHDDENKGMENFLDEMASMMSSNDANSSLFSEISGSTAGLLHFTSLILSKCGPAWKG
ncbi:uncharacterized protein [Primulina huaijiensis]